jgi:hypothetical protein
MAYKHYTRCYQHTPGDVPFRKADLLAFSAGASTLPLVGVIAAFLTGNVTVGFVLLGVGYATAIIAVADAWLNHRLACVSGRQCAVGRVMKSPEISDLGEFDNDEFIDVMLMPHRDDDDYAEENHNYTEGKPGKTIGGHPEKQPENDIYLDGFQGEEFMKPFLEDLPYKLDRAKLHCEAEGNFWVKMKEWAAIAGAVVAAAAAGGAAAGAAAGCSIGFALFGPIGCAIGAIIGAILGGAGGAAGGHVLVSWIAFSADPGDVEDANVGDRALGEISAGDKVVVLGEHVYDGFHEGWHEFHPLMAIMKLNDEESSQYLEWIPELAVPPLGMVSLPADPPNLPLSLKNLTLEDMVLGLGSDKFRKRADWLRDNWCEKLNDAFSDATRTTQRRRKHRWTAHPTVDGCIEEGDTGFEITTPPKAPTHG